MIVLSDRQKRYIDILVLTLIPLIAAIIYARLCGGSIFKIYLPAGQWNDEVCYFKQIQAMVEHNVPYGYWGYNESSANVLSFGAWSFVMFIPYVIWGKIFGWNYFSPIACNIILMMIAYLILGLLSRKARECKYWVLAWTISFCIITRYMLSGMVEAFNYCLIILMLSLSMHIVNAREKQETEKTWTFYLLLLVIALLTLMRPYYVILNIIILWFAKQQNSKKRMIFVLGTMVLTLFLYFYINRNLCAPYLLPIINTEVIKPFMSGDFIEGCIAFWGKCVSGFQEIGKYIFERGFVGIVYCMFFMQMIFLIFSSAMSFRRNQKNQGMLQMFFCFIDSIQIMAIIIFYSIPVGSRHLLPLCIANCILIIMYQTRFWKILLIICTLILNYLQINDEYHAKLPFYDEHIAESINESEALMKQSMELTNQISWDNSVAYFFTDDKHPWYVFLYALPSWFSIQFDYTEVADDIDLLKSKYIFVAPDGSIDKKMQDLNAEIVCQGTEWRMYSKPSLQEEK